MIDQRLRTTKDRWIDPVATRLPAVATPGLVTLLSFVVTLLAAVLAGLGSRWWSLGVWLLGRFLDGLDGAVARYRATQGDLGGYLDLVADTVGYAAVPLAIAFAQGERGTWIACALLLASFYANAISWTLLAAIAEKRGRGAASYGAKTTVHMPPGLIEGAETIVFYVAMLARPEQAAELFGAMAVLVTVTIGQRVVWAMRSL
ncbi:MAG: CDP-alcohol phosphatidyltransferase family protein [Acidimicrobiia bacterium]